MNRTLIFGVSMAATLPLALGADDQTGPSAPPAKVATDLFQVPEGLEVTVWASTPQLFNPTNMDIDKEGRIWVCEGVRYRRHKDRQPAGDRVVVLEDSDGDGQADKSHTFVQEEALVAPLGIGVLDNKIYVSQPPELIVYTDVNRNLVFEPEVDKREVLLTGFNARNHDHSLHSVTAGPDGKLYFNVGNCGAIFEDQDQREFVIGGPYRGGGGEWFVDNHERAGEKSADGHVWTAGATFRMNADGSGLEVVGHGYRNSYEQTLTSYGDMFQNDNDDPPACRVSYILEYGCAGYFSRDARRYYRAEKRPGQEHWRNHWRQDDPGTMDAGDVYGGGSPTGVAFYENGALGDGFVGTLLAAEPGRNVVFSYQPRPHKGTFSLNRQDFVNTNKDKKFFGSDFVGGTQGKQQSETESHLLFRPSDVAVGPDGALYISDWYDARVGGHADLDDSCSGTIYRIAPKGFQPVVPDFDASTLEGALEALRSPAVNVRYLGFTALQEKGAEALPAVQEFIANEENPFVAVRGIWLLPHLGEEGRAACVEFLKNTDAQKRIAALRALRRVGVDILPHAQALAHDPDAGVRRDVALALRDLPAEKTKDIFLTLAQKVDYSDKNSLEALGLGAALQENEIWTHLRDKMGAGDALKWDDRFARLTWRLWPVAAVSALQQRALSSELSPEARNFAVESLAFIDHPDAVEAMLTVANEGSPARGAAMDWLFRRGTGEWQKHNVLPELKKRGIYDPDAVEVSEVLVAEPSGERTYTVEDVLALEGNAEKGKTTALRCAMCHQFEGAGMVYGPSLSGWGKGQPREVIARALVDPSADIAHGYKGTEIKTKDGKTVHGLVTSPGDPLVIISTGGVEQLIPRKMIASEKDLGRSLMMSAEQLGLTAQDVADVVSYLKVYE
ncbi:PVC-type heme-binding CxxCH protein [Roseibacillus ishigakijimensis]|uniref:C-type cytochrome n=1 Tax=Roseibacillus ishigakijimensis TaxID=454146 RepID=A0A934RRE2_9BACT|nr:PVC-type heme-binding CxxCH protein [Roseibacillus ishigakijimensis]MBK1832875.1 c-type cytochrome [Roseibacillus ishigakijimensis]